MVSRCKHGEPTRARRAWLSPVLLVAALSPAVLQTSESLSCKSGDTTLNELAIVVGGKDRIEFHPNVRRYEAWLSAGSDVASIRALPTDPEAKLWLSRYSASGRDTAMEATSGGGDADTTLEPGLNTIRVYVKAPGGSSDSYEADLHVGSASPCVAVDCSDDNECTVDRCDPVDGSCSHLALEDGSTCSFGLVAGQCVVGACMPARVTATVCAQGCDSSTIQAAIDAAFYGDTILVLAGTYDESIDFLGKEIAVVAGEGPTSTTISGAGGSVVTFQSGETRSAILQGFTITNGFATEGGGIKIQSGSPSIVENVIVDNRGCAGGGIGIGFGSPLVLRNQIVGNTKEGCSGGTGGGGIVIRGRGAAEVIDNLIADNTSSDGGGISLFAAGYPTIRGNEIRDNVVAGEGGGLRLVNHSDALITQNVIHGNVAIEGGGIAWLVPLGTRGPRLVHNTIVNNHSPLGSGVFAVGFQNETALYNNIIVGKPGQTAVLCDDTWGNDEPIFAYNDIFSEGAAAYGGSCSDHTGESFNISRDPRFVNPIAGDFDIEGTSPAIDSGDVTLLDVPSDDFLGRARPIDGNADGVAEPDLGAFEYQRAGGEIVPLHLIRTWPAADEREVDLDATVGAEIGEDPLVGEPIFFVLEDHQGNEVDGAVEYDESSNTVMFTPSVPFVLAGVYTATVRVAFIDESGAALVGEHEWSFETREGQWGSAERFDVHVGGTSEYPRIVMTANGEALGLWKHFDGQKNYLWTRRFDPDAGWTDAFRHVTPEVEPERSPNLPEVAIDRDGNAFIVTGQFMNGGFRDMWAQRFDAGLSEWGLMERLEVLPGAVAVPDVVVDDLGVATAAWAQVGVSSLNVWVSRYSPGAGWSDAEVLFEDEGNSAPSLASDGNGNVALVMQHFCPGLGFCVAASFYLQGLGWSEPEVVNPGFFNESRDPRVAMNRSGGAVVVWEQFNAQTSDIVASRWSAAEGWTDPTAIERTANASTDPRVAIDDDGNAVAVWSQDGGARQVIMAARYESGVGWSAQVPIDEASGGDADQVRLVMDRGGNAIAVWRQADGDEDRIWANRFRPTHGWTGSVRIDGGAPASAYPRVAVDERGRSFVIWMELVGSSWEIWIRRFD